MDSTFEIQTMQFIINLKYVDDTVQQKKKFYLHFGETSLRKLLHSLEAAIRIRAYNITRTNPSYGMAALWASW